ncbi:LuxR C-terminal-related transcriptional regulator [Streptomyces sp. MCA2]|uniref:LuxR C-terminal-related transcriptional regulator n=1 Tax=Streptomyces sp. MCA2 TaxID=2944805 RepID=UPI002021D309|nr:LuxR family transcriptional regulator [Streptomyces sp. MCA2]MCL7491272.1 LuxR C-terminal-related transcriptional regulator [Streptomyces sp. MCA2]
MEEVICLLDPKHSRPATVEIQGEPWIGKTRLLQQILGAARQRGWAVAHAAAGPPAGASPYQLFADAFEEVLSERADEVFRSVPVAYQRALGLVFPALDRKAQSGSVPVPAGTVGSALRQVLRELAGSQGLVLALDNVHWADPASLELLESLVRRPPGARLLIAVTHRNRQSPLHLRGLLASLSGSYRIALGPLPEQELAALLPKRMVRPSRKNLISRAGGNPGLLLALSDSPENCEGTESGDLTLAPFARFLDEFRAVSDDGWLAAQSAAILGDTFTLPEMQSVAALPTERLVGAVTELLREDIIRLCRTADTYCFRHPILRETVYRTTGEEWRLAAHSAATQLMRMPVPSTYPALEPMPSRTPAADRVRSRLLPNEAGHSPGDETRIYEQRVRTGKALVVAGRPREALDILDRTSRPGADVPLLVRAEAAEWRAWAQRLLGRHSLAESLLTTVRAEVAAEPEALALVELARLATVLERGSLPDDELSTAVRWAAAQHDPLARAYTWALLGAQEADSGRTGQAAVRLREVAGLLDGLDDSTLLGRLDALYWLARAQARLEQEAEAARHFERGLGIAVAHELEYLVPQFATGLAEVCLRQGRIDLAVESGRQAIRAADRIGGACLLAEAGAGLARATWVSGDQATAWDTARRAAEQAEAWREPWADRVRLSLLETTFDTHDQELCKGLLSMGIVRRAATFPIVALVPAVGEVLARLESERSGSDAEAGRWATAAEEAAGRLQLPGATGLALLARAHHHRSADPLKAAAFASSAVVTLTRAGRTLDVARAHLAAAAAWNVVDSAVARSQFNEARLLLDECGAHGYLEHTVSQAANGGGQSADARLARLSGREREISVLVSDGYTNQQIARALELSHKTVETHLGRIFKKLKVGSRAQVATSIGRATRITDTQFPGRQTLRSGRNRIA